MEASTLLPLPVLGAALRPTPTAARPYAVPTLRPTIVASPLKRKVINGLFTLVEAGLVLRFLRRPAKVRQALAQLKVLRRQYFGEFVPHKVA